MPITQDNADILIISDGAGRWDAQGALRGVFAVADWLLDATLDTSGPDSIVERPVVIDVDMTEAGRIQPGQGEAEIPQGWSRAGCSTI